MSGSPFRWGAASHVGQAREINQDNMFTTDGIFVVADGMGGHRGGEVASEVTVTTIEHEGELDDLDAVLDGIGHANAAVLQRASSDPSLAGMGTTICAVVLIGRPEPHLVVANVGDSRVYRYADGALSQITEDHSLVETLVREGQLTPDEALVHPQRNILTRALGVGPDLDIDYWELGIRRGDRFVLCSDGLFNEVTDTQLADMTGATEDPQQLADTLVERANRQGGRDNITVVVVDIVAGDDGSVVGIGSRQVAQRAAGWGAVDGAVTAGVRRAPIVDEVRGVLADAPAAVPGGAATDSAEVVAEPSDNETEAGPTPRRRWRWVPTVFFVLAVLAVLGLGLWLVGDWARSNYFVAVDGRDAVIMQGQRGGVLWFDPTAEERWCLTRDLTPEEELVLGDRSFDSLEAARSHVQGLGAEAPVNGDCAFPAPEPTPTPTAIATPGASPSPTEGGGRPTATAEPTPAT